MQRYFSENKKNNQLILNKDDLHHIKKVMRMKDNDLIEVVYENKVFICKLSEINSDIKINIISEEEDVQKDKLEVTLIIPLLKENKMDIILQKATELGVKRIIPVITERSIIKLDEKKETKKQERWVKICKEASEQSKRVDIPIVSEVMNFKQLELLEGDKIVCSTSEKDNNIRLYLKNNKMCDKINVVIGPEGGLSKREEDLLVEIGFKPVSLGKRIMRVETVPLFILSVLNYEYME
jgi:16S rRNA (uracil1498-N3)-methyltransferase